MEGYKVNIVKTSKEMSAREKIKLKDFSNAVQLDEVTQGEKPVIIEVDSFAVCEVHNEKSDNKDYTKYVIISKAGTKYVTGSESFFTSLADIMDELADAGETDCTIEVYRKDSKNYKGKQFLTCSIV